MTDISKFRSLIRNQDFGGIEFARDEVRGNPALADALAEHYWRLETWKERSLLVQLVQDCKRPALVALMQDFLRAPIPDDTWADHMELTKAVAVCHIQGDADGDLFRTYLDDRDQLHEDVADLLDEQGQELTATPEMEV